MYIIKRNGQREDMLLDKITSRIKKLCYGLDKKYIDPSSITLKVCLYPRAHAGHPKEIRFPRTKMILNPINVAIRCAFGDGTERKRV